MIVSFVLSIIRLILGLWLGKKNEPLISAPADPRAAAFFRGQRVRCETVAKVDVPGSSFYPWDGD
jgi:hypothetical protein